MVELHNVIWLKRTELSDELARFFLVWSRFEFALKAGGFGRPGADGEPTIYWGRFARAVERTYSPELSSTFAAAVEYIFEHPPQKQQVSASGELFWAPFEFRDSDSDAWRLIMFVRAIRNNLFHGGSYNRVGAEELGGRSEDEWVADPDYDPSIDPIRDLRLLAVAQFVIDAFLDFVPELQPIFYDGGRRHRLHKPE